MPTRDEPHQHAPSGAAHQPRGLGATFARVSAARALWAGLACAVGLAGFVRWAATPYLIDDAFISFRYARNLVEGQGLVYNVGERVEGYTNFLWTLFAALALELGGDPLRATQALGVASYVASLAGSVWLVGHLAGRRPESAIAALYVLTAVIADGVAGFAGSGMEPTWVGLLALGVMASHVSESRGALVSRGLVCLLGTLTRLDFAPLVVASGLITLLRARRDGLDLRATLSRGALAFGLPLVVMVAYLATKTAYYGELLPNTYYVKGADGLQLEPGLAYLRAFVVGSPWLVLGIPFVLLASRLPSPAAASAGDTRRDALDFAALGLALHVAYVVKAGGDFMQYRFMVHVLPLALVGVATSLARVVASVGRLELGAFVVALSCLLATAPPVLEERFHMETVASMDSCCGPIGLDLGAALGERLPPETYIATSMAGGIPYASRLPTLDMLGLTDATIARSGATTEEFYRGHMRSASVDYMRERGVNLVIGHPTLCSCAQPCVEDVSNVFIDVGEGRCLRTWYLTPDEALTRHFCENPSHFVLSRVPCPAPATEPSGSAPPSGT